MFFLKFEFFQKFLHIDFHYNNHIQHQIFLNANLCIHFISILIQDHLKQKDLLYYKFTRCFYIICLFFSYFFYFLIIIFLFVKKLFFHILFLSDYKFIFILNCIKYFLIKFKNKIPVFIIFS